jgi:hypothetical protein
MSAANMTDEGLLQTLAAYFDSWAAENGGKAYPAFDLSHLFEILSSKPGVPRVAVMVQGEETRESFPGAEVLGRVDRRFWLLISRGRGLQHNRGASLTDGAGGGKPMLQLVRELRDQCRAFNTGGWDSAMEFQIYYKGYQAWGIELGFPADTYRIEFELGCQLPVISNEPEDTVTVTPP